MTSRLVLTAAILLGWAWQAQAQVLNLQIANGRVTLDAQGVSVPQILAAWTRVGGTLMVNGDKVSDAPVTFRFVDAPEREVLASLLRDVAGYILAGGNAAPPGTATVGRVVILPTSSPVAGFSSNLPLGGFARQESAPEPDLEEASRPFPTRGVIQTGQGISPAGQVGSAFAQAAPEPAQAALFEAPVEEVPGPGFVPGMVDDRGRLVRGPTSEGGNSEPAIEAPPGTPVQPNPFGVTSGSASPGVIAPVRPSQP